LSSWEYSTDVNKTVKSDHVKVKEKLLSPSNDYVLVTRAKIKFKGHFD